MKILSCFKMSSSSSLSLSSSAQFLKFTLILFMMLSLYEQYSYSHTHTHNRREGGLSVVLFRILWLMNTFSRFTAHCWHYMRTWAWAKSRKYYASFFLSHKICIFSSSATAAASLLHNFIASHIFPTLGENLFPSFFSFLVIFMLAPIVLCIMASYSTESLSLSLCDVCCLGRKIFKAWMKYFYDLTRFSLGNFERTFFLVEKRNCLSAV